MFWNSTTGSWWWTMSKKRTDDFSEFVNDDGEFDYAEAFEELMPHSLSMSSYDLMEVTGDFGATRDGWKKYLSDPAVKKRIAEDMEEIRQASLNQLVGDAARSRSVGQAQLVTSLMKFGEANKGRPEQVFIYSHVPLTDEQQYSPAAGRADGKKIVR